MKYMEALAVLLAQGLLLASGLPQGGYSSQAAPSAGYGASVSASGSCCGNNAPSTVSASYATSSSQELQGSAASFGQDSFAQQPSSFGAFGGNGGGGGGQQGGNLRVECQRREVSPGQYKFVCDGANRDAISLRSEHVLWITGEGGQSQVVDIEIPNYRIEELIKAGFKVAPGAGSQINLLLKKPEQNYDAQVDKLPAPGGNPSVNLQYEPVQKLLVHYPNDKPYSPIQYPILPPLAGGRGQRQVPKQFSKPYSQQDQIQAVLPQQQQVQRS